LIVGGLVCFVLGAFTLYTDPGTPVAPDVAVAVPLIVTMAAVTAAYVGLVLLTVARVRRRSVALATTYGAGGSMTVPPGTAGIAKTALEPRGVVYAAGEEWTARTHDAAPIARGAPIRVVGQQDLTLIVESGPAPSPEGG
jgi:membrane-bound ClpP family serine protease